MRVCKTILNALLLTVSLSIVSCSDNSRDNQESTLEKEADAAGNAIEDAGEHVGNMAEAAGQEIEQERKDLEIRMDAESAKINARIEELQAQAKTASAKEKKKIDEQMDKLKAKKTRMDEYMTRAKNETKEDWSEFRTNVNNFFDEVEKDIKN